MHAEEADQNNILVYTATATKYSNTLGRGCLLARTPTKFESEMPEHQFPNTPYLRRIDLEFGDPPHDELQLE